MTVTEVVVPVSTPPDGLTPEGHAAAGQNAATTRTVHQDGHAAAEAGDSAVGTLGTEANARLWIERWDRQQERYIPDRETVFTVIGDAVDSIIDTESDPLVIDLGCGPGSLSARLLERFHKAGREGARVIGVDADPLLLHLARSVYGAIGLAVVDHDLRDPGWTAALGLEQQADAVVSTTALHWLTTDQLGLVYAKAAQLLRPGGILLNGDHMRTSASALTAVQRAVELRQADRFEVLEREDWDEWWAAITADPKLSGPVAQRAQRPAWHPEHRPVRHEEHVEVLRAAGFGEVGSIWQYGERHILAAVKV
jgi:SAM-dependent methyltransferase